MERAAAVLQLLAGQEEPLPLAQIAAALDLAKPTAHGLLRTLADVGFVEQEGPGGRYRVAPDLFRLGVPHFDLNELRSRAMNWTDSLAARTGESARVAAFRDGYAVLAHHVFRADDTPQTVATGARIPLHASALGKVLLAFDPGAARSLIGVVPEPLTHRTVISPHQRQRELAAVRDSGWAVDVEEQRAGLAGIAAPIRDRGGYVVASVGVEGELSRLCDERGRPRPAMLADVQRAARSISRELGHGRPG